MEEQVTTLKELAAKEASDRVKKVSEFLVLAAVIVAVTEVGYAISDKVAASTFTAMFLVAIFLILVSIRLRMDT